MNDRDTSGHFRGVDKASPKSAINGIIEKRARGDGNADRAGGRTDKAALHNDRGFGSGGSFSAEIGSVGGFQVHLR